MAREQLRKFLYKNRTPLNGQKPTRPVKAVDSVTNEIVGEFDSIKDAGDKLGIRESTISLHCKKNRETDPIVIYQKMNLIFTYNDKPLF